MIYLGVIAALALLDLVIKSGIEAIPEKRFPRFFPGAGKKLELRKVHNPGFPMGFLGKRPALVRALSLAAAGALLLRFSLLLPKRRRTLEKFGLAMALGGAASNLTDRFFRGFAVDYLYVGVKPLSRFVFNLGDVFIALGMALTCAAQLLPGEGGRAAEGAGSGRS